MLMLLTSTALAASAPIAFSITDVEALNVTLKRTSFSLVAQAERLKGMPVKVKQLDYNIRVGDSVVSQDTLALQGVKLRVGEPVQVQIPCEFENLSTAGALVGAVTGALSGHDLRVTLSGTAHLKFLGIFGKQIEFETAVVEVSG